MMQRSPRLLLDVALLYLAMSRDSICYNAPLCKIKQKARIDLPIVKIVLERLHTGFIPSASFLHRSFRAFLTLLKYRVSSQIFVLQASSFHRVLSAFI